MRLERITPPPPAPPCDFDASGIDLDALYADLKKLRQEAEASLGEEDLAHLRKFEWVGRIGTFVGLATAWMGPNPVSIAGLAVGRGSRWIMMHHIGHKGYDRVPGVPPRYTSKVFARGTRRFLDWCDWMIPEAWNYEHNVLHHAYTGEERDPDLIERNAAWVRDMKVPVPVRYAMVGLLALSWKPFYYASNTLEVYRARFGDDGQSFKRQLWTRCYLPYAGITFGLLPSLFAPLGPLAVGSALVNSIAAELVTNVHTFLVIGPNHTGDDLFLFDDKPGSKGEHMLRQILGSVNYATGDEVTDWLHLWLNYQIEHHIFPDMPMLKYRQMQPKVKALCAKHGIPYVQESVWKRAGKMLEIAVGTRSMKRASRALLGLADAAKSVSTRRPTRRDGRDGQGGASADHDAAANALAMS